MKKPNIIGIAGGTASGKTTLAYKIKEEFKESVVILSHDFYYKSLSNITLEERLKRNYDCPDAYETDLLIRDIKTLLSGKIIQRPIYSYTNRLRENETVNVNPVPIILVEGILVLENIELSDLMDIKIFVDTDADIRLTRLIERDRKERGLDIDYIISKYKNTLKPMHEKYIEPSKKNANIIISGNMDDFNIVIQKVKNILENK